MLRFSLLLTVFSITAFIAKTMVTFIIIINNKLKS